MPGRVLAGPGRKLGRTTKEFEIRATGRPSASAAPVVSTRPRANQTQPGEPANFSFAVWDLADYALHRDIVYSRACDDLIGVAGVLATLIELKQSRAPVNVLGLISRAEEVGFYGALTIAHSGSIPKNALIISLETSRELPGVKIGQGVILRVGDRSSVFDPAATRSLEQVANQIKVRRKPLSFQRALMSGGTCEATAYQQFGYQTTAVCIALGNYHNCSEHHKIATEYVSVKDACGMVGWPGRNGPANPELPCIAARTPHPHEDPAAYRHPVLKTQKVRSLLLDRGL